MVVSHREPSISSNIRAIIEQLNLNPVERRRLIDKTRQESARCRSFPSAESPPKITIGVYGCEDRHEFEIPAPVKPARKIDERSRSKAETRQRFAGQVTKEASTECANEDTIKGELEYQPIVSIGSLSNDEIRAKSTSKVPPKGQRTIRREQIRIGSAIEDKVADASTVPTRPSYKIEDRPRSKQRDTTSQIAQATKEYPRVDDTVEITKTAKDAIDRSSAVAKEDLPQLESASLNHTAAHHRISVRPKNRRPPRRTTSTTCNVAVAVSASPSVPTIAEDTLDSLEQQQTTTLIGNTSSPIEAKTISVARKSSCRLSRNSDIFEELESRLPRRLSAASLSPDSLDTTATSRSSAEMADEVEIRSVARRPSNRISKGSDVFEELEAKLPHRRSSSNRLSKSPDSLDSGSCWFSKSTEGFDKLVEYEETKPVIKRLLNPISKSTDRVSKSSDSLEAIEPLVSDDSIERRRSSFEFRARRSSKAMSKSSENFDALDQNGCVPEEIGQELQKRSSIPDINLSRGRRLSKNISKSSESFERIDTSETKDVEAEVSEDTSKSCRWSSKRISSDSSDNLDMEDKLENRKSKWTPRRIPSTSIVDMISAEEHEGERRPAPNKKPPRLQKSSENSELGSTDTLDSERRNKSSESTETLDSLDKDLEQDRKNEEITDSVVDKREKNDSWSSKNVAVSDSDQTSMGDDTEESKSLISSDKYYWRQSTESKENLGIHQLLAITIMTRMADNGNNQRSSVMYSKKKQQMSTSQPTSPVAKQEDTKMLFDNLLVSKNDEDLQNMLNGNISEVSTDTKSFKEKLIMFEKLGK